MKELDTIAAIATPPGIGGIGIIRISGPKSFCIASCLFRPGPVPKDENVDVGKTVSLRPWHLHYGHIFDPSTKQAYDEVLLAFMPAPRSYTKEDIVEIQAHAGPAVLKRILGLVIQQEGVRLAEPGEFTRRAFLNGRIDLTEAEAVMDMITARSEMALDIAMAHLSGRFGRSVNDLIQRLHELRALVEAEIDFPESVEDEFDFESLSSDIRESVFIPVKRLIEQHHAANFFREGLSVVIAGGPNVGKSSLMNRLLEKDRVIVSDIPGTTRDFVEESMVCRGIPLLLCDTAGFRANPESIEALGIDNATRAISQADLILFVVDASRPINEDERDLFKLVESKKKRRIVVFNKWDLVQGEGGFHDFSVFEDFVRVKTSCIENTGIDKLQDAIRDVVFSDHHIANDLVVPNLRQKKALETAASCLAAALNILETEGSFGAELAAIDLRDAENALMEVVGHRALPDLLDSVFNRFCVGK